MKSQWYLNARIVLDTAIIENGYVQVVNGKIAKVGQGCPLDVSADDEVLNLGGLDSSRVC